MYYLPLALLTWTLAPWIVDRKRLPELLVYGLFGGALATIQDRLVMVYHLWEYHDTGWLSTHPQVALLISFSAAPLFGMRFAQGLVADQRVPWKRIARFAAVAMLPEIIGLYRGNISYGYFWNVWWSAAAYIPIWLSFWALHGWLGRRVPRNGTSALTAQETASGV